MPSSFGSLGNLIAFIPVITGLSSKSMRVDSIPLDNDLAFGAFVGKCKEAEIIEAKLCL